MVSRIFYLEMVVETSGRTLGGVSRGDGRGILIRPNLRNEEDQEIKMEWLDGRIKSSRGLRDRKRMRIRE